MIDLDRSSSQGCQSNSHPDQLTPSLACRAIELDVLPGHYPFPWYEADNDAAACCLLPEG
jgi:hypothetical protein